MAVICSSHDEPGVRILIEYQVVDLEESDNAIVLIKVGCFHAEKSRIETQSQFLGCSGDVLLTDSGGSRECAGGNEPCLTLQDNFNDTVERITLIGERVVDNATRGVAKYYDQRRCLTEAGRLESESLWVDAGARRGLDDVEVPNLEIKDLLEYYLDVAAGDDGCDRRA